MTSNRKKMYETNTRIRKYLAEQGFVYLYLFPHLRFQKDYTFGAGCGFDAFGWKDGVIWFFQFKTNRKLPKKELTKYKIIEENYNCKCAWVTTIKRSSKILFQNVK